MASPLGLSIPAQYSSTNQIGKHTIYSGNNPEGANVGAKVKSLFGRSVFSPFPESIDANGNVLSVQSIRSVHSDETYDTSIESLVKYTSNKRSQKLRFADFAYTKHVGVYPNNRLIIARRFPGAVGNDLNTVNSSPLATMISWFNEEDQDWFRLSFNEEWEEADADFTNVMNDIGDTFKSGGVSSTGKGLGNFLGQGLNILPFGGFSEPLQRLVFSKLGFVDDPYNLPLGNPNLIRQAKRRKLVGKGEAESGLACEIEIKMTVEYEQKFINNVDPTIVYLDLIQNALTFGTSDASFQMSGGFGNTFGGLLQNLVAGNFGAIFNTIKRVIGDLFNLIKGFAQEVINALTNPKQFVQAIGNVIDGAISVFKKSIGAIAGKFKVKLMGIMNALTGAPSCPWHITIGNPKRPFFSSGDMQLKSVDVEFGSTLAFNDLPTSIKFNLTFGNARPLGANEIFNRLNTGKGRSYLRVHIEPRDKDDKTIYNDDNNEPDRLANGSFEEYSQDDKGGKGKGKTHSDVLYSYLGQTTEDYLPEYVAPPAEVEPTNSDSYTEPEPTPNESVQDDPQPTPPAQAAPPQPPPARYSVSIGFVGTDWYVEIRLNNRLIDVQKFASSTQTRDQVKQYLQDTGRSFGFTEYSPPDGPRFERSMVTSHPAQPDLVVN